MTFAQLLRGWLLVLGIMEGLVECATVCVKSLVILDLHTYLTTSLSRLLQLMMALL